MNDQVLMDNYLLLLKSCVEVYVHGTLESSNIDVRNTLDKCLIDIMGSQAVTYDNMVSYNWYQVNNLATSKIKPVLNKVLENE